MSQAFKFSIVFFFLSLANWLSAEVVKLAAPNFSEDQILGEKIRMKACHKTSLHLKAVIHYYHEKPVILVHNYGQGEAGWTYAPGSMEIAYENMHNAYKAIGKVPVPANERIAVLGAGVNGLMIANKLAENGYPVTIYSSSFSPNTLSDIYAGAFIPMLSSKKAGNKQMERLETLSYKIYQNWADSQKDLERQTVSPIDLYIVNDENSFDFLVAQGLIPKPESVQVNLGTEYDILTLKYRSFILNTTLIMEEMMAKAKKLGVKFVNKKINSLTDCMELQTDVVFNCIGLGSNEVFGDDHDIPFIGYMINFNDTVGIDYVMYVNYSDGTYTYWLSKDKKASITGTFIGFNQENVTDEFYIKQLFERAGKLFKEYAE